MVSLTLGFAFLYVPIVILVIYSFNDSKLVTVWGGFSTRWYAALLHDQAMLDAAWVTLRLGAGFGHCRDGARHAGRHRLGAGSGGSPGARCSPA